MKTIKGLSSTQWLKYGMVAISAFANAYASAKHAEDGVGKVFAIVLGIGIPVAVLILGGKASQHFQAGRRGLSIGGAIVGIALLILSLWHIAEAIHSIGVHVVQAVLFAIGIDCTIVYCEISEVAEHKRPARKPREPKLVIPSAKQPSRARKNRLPVNSN